MDPVWLGIILFICVFGVLMFGVPIWLGLAMVSVVYLVIVAPEDLTTLPLVIFSSINKFALLAIPLFIFMAAPLAASRASADLYETVHRWLHWLPGGIGVTNIISCAVFAALCGSSPATAAAIGGIGIPQMRERGYPAGFACGVIAVGGTMGILIPPSITMILYGIATETSIGKCFMAGVFPGLLLAGLASLWTILYFCFFIQRRRGKGLKRTDSSASDTKRAPVYGEQKFTWRARLTILPRIVPFLLIIFGVLGSLYLGWASPSEAAGVGAVLAFLLTLIIYRTYHRQDLRRIFSTSLSQSTMILMIMAMALLFAYVLSHAYATQAMAEAMIGLPFGKWGTMAVVQVFLLILGMFIPPAAVIIMVSPLLMEVLIPLGFDPVWFAAIITLNLEVGLVTPPVALNLYIVKDIAPDISMSRVLNGSFPFILCIVVTIALTSMFPAIALWLPTQMIGG